MKALAIFLITLVSGFFFFHSAVEVERKTHARIESDLVEHPEFIPKAGDIRLVSSGFEPLIADFYWLSSIQYVGGNAISSEYKKYLYRMLDLVTDLDPYFDYPYEIGLLLLPDYNPRYENLSPEERAKNIEETIALGEKGIASSCDAEKIAKIRKEEDLASVWTSSEYANPCRNAMIPYYLAYVEQWNRKNPIAASEYYKIASANADAPKAARIMSAIMRGKGGERQKSILMFLSIAESISDGEKQNDCKDFASQMRGILVDGFSKNASIPTEFLKTVEGLRTQIVRHLGEEKLEVGNMDSFCSTYLNKAVRELNLQYVTESDAAFAAKTGKKASDAKELFDWGGLPYLPRDFQKFEDGSEVIYVRGEDGEWDYSTGRY